MKYSVQMLVTGTITKVIDEADSPEDAKELACEKYGDRSIILCSYCVDKVGGLSISEDPDTYEVELLDACMGKYNVRMLVTGTVTKKVEADSSEESKKIASEKYGDKSIMLCSHCAREVCCLSISENPDIYEVEPVDTNIDGENNV